MDNFYCIYKILRTLEKALNAFFFSKLNNNLLLRHKLKTQRRFISCYSDHFILSQPREGEEKIAQNG